MFILNIIRQKNAKDKNVFAMKISICLANNFYLMPVLVSSMVIEGGKQMANLEAGSASTSNLVVKTIRTVIGALTKDMSKTST